MYLKKSPSLSWLSFASILVQASAFLTTFLLIKIYSPQNFGTFSTFVSWISILTLIATCNVDYAIVLAKNANDSKIVFQKTFTLLCVFVVIMALVATIWQVQMFFLYPIGVFLCSFNQLCDYYLVKKNQFKWVAICKILSISAVILQYFLGFYTTSFGLIIGFLISIFIASLFQIFIIKMDVLKLNFQLKSLYLDNKTLVNYGFPANLINLLAYNLIPIFILYYFSSYQTGIYFLAAKLLAAGVLFISNSYSKIFHVIAAQLFNHSKHIFLYHYSKKILVFMLLFSIFYVVFIYSFSYYIMPFIAIKWQNVPSFVLILAPYFLMRILCNPFSFLIEILRINKFGLFFNISQLLATLVGIGIGVYCQDLKIGLLVLAYLNTLFFIIFISYIFKTLKNNATICNLKK